MTLAVDELNDIWQTRQNRNVDVLKVAKWLRVFFSGEYIADSKDVILVRQRGRTPVYYFPRQDVRTDFLVKSGKKASLEGLGEASYWTVRVGEKAAEDAAWSIANPEQEAADIADYLAFKWREMDAWFEESEEVFVHPTDPFSRIDVRASSRNVRIVIAGETVAESDRPVLLFETGLPTRFYIPKVDVRMDLLEASDLHTECPYKGVASYYSVRVGDELAKNIAWYYPFPHPEVGKIQNLIAFYDEKVEAVFVDGEKQKKPNTPWS